MKRYIFYLAAIGLHLVVLFGIKPPTPTRVPPSKYEKYVEVTLVQPPIPEPTPPTPPPPEPPPLPPPVEQPPPPEPPKPEPPPPPPTPDVLPERVPEPPPTPPPPTPAPTSQPMAPEPVQTIAREPVIAPPNPYVNVTQPSYASRVEPEYPLPARRLHQHGTVTLALYINVLGSLDKVEVIKSSGSSLLDDAAIDAMKESRFHPAYQGDTPVLSRAEVSINFVMEGH